jgi:pantetheine-phosphate adenylyltransferase
MYKHIALGGTFDGLHKGHKYFLSQAFAKGARVTIGLTSGKYITRYKNGIGVSPYSKRYRDLTTWLRQEGYSSRVVIIPLHDPLGPAILPDEFDAIAVTSDNSHVATRINTRRQEMGFPPLKIISIDLLKGEDTKVISSSRLRRGEITKEGKLMLPEGLRSDLQKPMGKVLTPTQIAYSVLHYRDHVIITVGDVTTQKVFSFGVQPSLVIIDLQVERKPYQTLEAYKFPKKYVIKHIASGPGFISKKAVTAIQIWRKHVKKRTVLVINGEEDLLVLPALVHAPIGSILYYGQPLVGQVEGLVEVVVTSQIKQKATQLFKQFT